MVDSQHHQQQQQQQQQFQPQQQHQNIISNNGGIQAQPPIFQDLKFFLQEEYIQQYPNQSEKITRLIQKHGGKRVFNELDDTIYLFQDFNGEQYENARLLKKPIISIHYLFGCAQKNKPLDFSIISEYPLFSDCLMGTVICTSGFNDEEKAYLSSHIESLCGTFKYTLSYDVTHLITNRNTTGSKRVKHARSLGIPLVDADWLKECWSSEQKVDIQPYILPLFFDCIICTTGFTIAEKKEIERIVRSNGGEFSGELKASCTILISNGAISQKCVKADQWSIPVVNIDWFKKTIEVHFYQNENNYALQNVDQQPQQQFQQIQSYLPMPQQQQQFQQQPQQQQQQQQSRLLQKQQLQYLPLQSQQSYKSDSFSGSSSSNPAVNINTKYRPTPMPNKVQKTRPSYQQQQPLPPQTLNNSLGNINNSSRQMKSSNRNINNSSYSNINNSNNLYANNEFNSEMMAVDDSSMMNTHNNDLISYEQPLFHGKNILIQGFPDDEMDKVLDHISKYGASVIDCRQITTQWTSTTFNIQYIMAPHEKKIQINDNCTNIPIVTIDWFDKCLNNNQIYDPEECAIFKPLPCILFLKGVSITTDGYNEYETSFLRSTAKLLGAKFTQKLYPESTTHLITSVRGQKYQIALSLNINIVTPEWLNKCASSGTKVDENIYLLNQLLTNSSNKSTTTTSTSTTTTTTAKKPTAIFKDLVFYISSKLINTNESSNYIQYIKELGGVLTSSGFDRITHYITNEVDHTETPGFVNTNFYQVNPKWLEQCWNLKKKLLESDYQPKQAISNDEDDISLPTIQSLTKTPSQLFNASNSTQEKEKQTTLVTDDKQNEEILEATIEIQHQQQEEDETMSKDDGEETTKITEITDDSIDTSLNITTTTITTTTPKAKSSGFDKVFKLLKEFPVNNNNNNNNNNNRSHHSKISVMSRSIGGDLGPQNRVSVIQKSNKPFSNISALMNESKDKDQQDDSENESMKDDDNSNSNNNILSNHSGGVDNDNDDNMHHEGHYYTNSSYSETSSQMITYGEDTEKRKKEKLLESNFEFFSKNPNQSFNANSQDVQQSLLNMLNRKPTQQSEVPISSYYSNVGISIGNGNGNQQQTAAKKYVFAMSGVADEKEQSQFKDIISKFGGLFEALIAKNVTHVITKQVSRSEKVMGGCASGAWVLKTSYLVASLTANKFVDEKDHQWQLNSNEQADSPENIWIQSSICCQKTVSQNGRKLFDGSRVAFFKMNKNIDAWKKILLCGDSELVEIDYPINKQQLYVNNVTHLLIIKKKGVELEDTTPIANDPKISILYSNQIVQCLNKGEYLIPQPIKKK